MTTVETTTPDVKALKVALADAEAELAAVEGRLSAAEQAADVDRIVGEQQRRSDAVVRAHVARTAWLAARVAQTEVALEENRAEVEVANRAAYAALDRIRELQEEQRRLGASAQQAEGRRLALGHQLAKRRGELEEHRKRGTPR